MNFVLLLYFKLFLQTRCEACFRKLLHCWLRSFIHSLFYANALSLIGTFRLFPDHTADADDKEANVIMEYKFDLSTTEGVSYHFKGLKRREKHGLGVQDTTTLFTELHAGGENGSRIAEGILKIHLTDFMKQMQTIEITNAQSEMLKAKWTSEFGALFFGQLWFSHGGFVASKYKQSLEAGRMKRKLQIKGVTPQIMPFQTEDKVWLVL